VNVASAVSLCISVYTFISPHCREAKTFLLYTLPKNFSWHHMQLK